MAESVLTKDIKLGLYYYTKAHLQGVYGVFECVMGANTMGYGNEYVDFLTMDSDNIFRCYEIKVSKEDLHSKAQLSFYGDYNYLVVPEELFGEALRFVRERYLRKTGILVYHVSGMRGVKPHFDCPWKPERQKLRIEQRIANMYNMIRSGSRYTTKWVKGQEKVKAGKGIEGKFLDPEYPVSDEEFVDMFGHHKDYA